MAYNKHDWVTGELITADKMNAIENGLDNANLIECDFKGRTKYLKGIDIDANTGIGTLKFYNGSNEKGNSEVKFFTLDSANVFTDDQIAFLESKMAFFTQEQGKEYIDQKLEDEFFTTERFPETLKEYLSDELSNDEKTSNKFIVPKSAIDTALDTKLDKTSVAVVGEDEEIDWTEDKLVSAKDIDDRINEKISGLISSNTTLSQLIDKQKIRIDSLYGILTQLIYPVELWNGNEYGEGRVIRLSQDINSFDYLDFYIDHRTANEKTVYTFKIPNQIKADGEVFTIRNSNISNTYTSNPDTFINGLEVCEMYLNIKNSQITITQNQKVAWDGHQNHDGMWTRITSPTTDTDAVIKIKRIIGRTGWNGLAQRIIDGGYDNDSNS